MTRIRANAGHMPVAGVIKKLFFRVKYSIRADAIAPHESKICHA